ncbi:hypothetical protein [Kitasatospora sp. NPDC058190]|uniref:hypothetical protein n=1 Tax=Kitasatospora sp. NPDC058190 TaxID=3346371 RepID=UPI0036DD9384
MALSAAAVLAPVTTAAAATTPVTGNEAIVSVGAVGPEPIVSPDGTRVYVAGTNDAATAGLRITQH